MEATLSTKGQLVLPAEARRRLRLAKGDKVTIEVRGDSLVLRPARRRGRYTSARHPASGLPVMVAARPPKRRVGASEIARLLAEIL